MLNLQSLKVEIFNTDIAPMVLSLTMFETIKGNLRGSMTVLDNINFMDNFIGTSHAPIKIQWGYKGFLWTNYFYGDGLEKMEIIKTGKQYNIHFIAYNTMNEQFKIINSVYSGRSDQIIHNIFIEACGSAKDAPLLIDSKTITKGKYLVPNISAHQAISNVVNSSYDENKSGMFLYQRACEQGITRLSSLHYMNNNYFYQVDLIGASTFKTVYKLRATVAGADTESDGIDPNSQIGTTSGFMLDEYNMNFTAKVAYGNYGHKVQNIKLDETASKNFEPAELKSSQIPITSFPLSSALYDNNTKSVFSTSCEPEAYAAGNQKRRVFNQRMTAPNVIAVPGLGCGYSIEVESGGSNLSKTKTDTGYIVANINHKFIMHDGDHQYSQDIGLIRE